MIASQMLPDIALGREHGKGGTVVGGSAAAATLRIVGGEGDRMVDGVVIVKLDAPLALPRGMSQTGLSSLDKILGTQGTYSIEQAFPLPGRTLSPQGMELQRIFYVWYSSGENPRQAALRISRDPHVEYAVPWYVHRIHGQRAEQSPRTGQGALAVPNDPLYPDMGHLPHIQAPAAWDVVKGEQGGVVIAIVDGGTDWRHKDLIDNIWQNLGEDADGDGHTLEWETDKWVLDPGDLNGVDDDDWDDDPSTFIDDLIGWNFADESNDPTGLAKTPTLAEHGTAVAGVSSAVANNGIGVTGVSWNTLLMAVNASCEDTSLLCYGYKGVIYAAEAGADIINASWGSTHADLTSYEERALLQLMQDIVDFVIANGALLVSSAGNDTLNSDKVLSLPCGAPRVLSVGATGKDWAGVDWDLKADFSNWGISVDVFAPGEDLNTTAPSNKYITYASGTSFSSPLAAGIAALVKTRFPHFTPDQVAQQVRVTADPIDSANPTRAGLMGKGRINAYRAVTETTIPAIRIAGTSFQDSDADGFIESGETVDLTVALTNFLADADGVTVTLTQEDPNVSITVGEDAIPSLPSSYTAEVDFRFIVGDVDGEYPLYFTLDIDCGSYQDRDLIKLYANESRFITHDTGLLRVSLTTEGNIGWVGFADESPGEGFVYNGTNLLFEGGLLMGTSKRRISDCIRGPDEEPENDFWMPYPDQFVIIPGQTANEETDFLLTDEAASRPIGLTIRQQSYAENSSDYDDFVIFQYTITNTSGLTLSNLYAGLFFDWDIAEEALDYARFDHERCMGIIQNHGSNPSFLAATRLLTRTGDLSYRSIDNADEIYGGDAGDGFTAAEKWSFLSGGLQTERLDAMDASTLTAAGPFAMQPEESIEIAFAVIGAGSQEALETNADSAQAFWDSAISPAQPSHPPVFTRALTDTAIMSAQTLTFTYAAQDPDNDSLRFTLVDPPNASLDSLSGELTFQPPADFEGVVTITAAVSDGLFSSGTKATVTIKAAYQLSQNYANPFRLSIEGETTINYQLPKEGEVRLVVYDILGREVKTLVSDDSRPAGIYDVVWNGTDNSGRRVSSGIYLYRIQASDFSETRKLVLLK